jgi:hypothetical protein
MLVSAGFVLGGVYMHRDGEPIGLWIAGFFALCFVVGVVNALPGASELRLDREGFVVRSLFRSQAYRWADIVCFGVGSVSGMTLVTITRRSHAPAGPVRSFLIGDSDGALPATYGHSAVALAALLEDWRVGRPRPADPRELTSAVLLGVARSARSEGGLLVLKLSALFSFCGGPLYLSGVLDIKHRSPIYFSIPFAPIVLLLFGALALRDENSDKLGRWSVEGGLVGAALLTAMNVYAVIRLAGAPRQPDGGLVALGIAVGLCTAIVYTATAIPFLQRRQL